ncbi:MAG TPA: Rne/Rng family ribonuclease [Pseudomonadota bacterium]|nr:Rne/Rng family ribonuclease [Pseudomonadota bacterium]
MPNLLVINADGPETRVALVENSQVVEIYIERRRERGIVGNIYKGKVLRVLPGMQAAFVDIGTDKAAFLYVADVRGAPEDIKSLFVDEDDEARDRRNAEIDEKSKEARIEDLLRPGQEVIVQIAKAPIGTKGSRSTSYISLPGRNLVFMPTVDHVGISRRIGSDKERKRLRSIVDSMRPPGTGFIVRTVAESVSDAELRADMEFLIKLWNSIVKKSETAKAPALLYNDLDLLLRTVRDLFTSEVEKLIIDSRPEYERLLKFTGAFMPEYVSKIEYYDKSEPVFDAYGIEMELDRAVERKVYLKSGGSLVIDQGEALTAIDVNTGRFVGKRNLEETITKTNLEACKEVADQLRLRNIGGIIIIDFIDMDRESNQDKVMRAFAESVRPDRAKTNVTKISELGLVEMTRKRTRESLGRMLTEPCFYCDGKGYLKSKTTVAYEVLRQIRREGGAYADDVLVVSVHPEIGELLATADNEYLEALEKRLQKKINIKPRDRFHLEHFEIRGASTEAHHEKHGKSGGGHGDDREIIERGGVIRSAPASASEANQGDDTGPIAPQGRQGYRQE